MSATVVRPTPFQRPLLFLSLAFSVFMMLHGYVWLRLVAPLPLLAALPLSVTMLGLGGALLWAMRARFIGQSPSPALAWAAFGWLGLLFLSFMGNLFVEPLRQGSHLMGLSWGEPLSWATAAGTLLVGAWGFSKARMPERKEVRVQIQGLSPELNGFSIVQLSDVHVGHTIGKDFVEAMVARVNAEKADIVVITGDLVDGSVQDLREKVAPLGQLSGRYGVFFVTGNHEYMSGADEWVAELRRLGIQVLRNERVRVGGALDLVGVDDLFGSRIPGHGMDLDRALAGRDPSVPAVLLAHQPAVARLAKGRGIALQLSGHTHGGQLYPLHYLVGRLNPWLAGLQRQEDMQVYVHRGTGYWGPPFRVGAPGEITRLVLQTPS